ncbi:MAG TPA: hypothetical protein VJ183_05305 [Chloroflexia bacterium]|nr:hypothetical protein [Chloroflexia bacterium]
MNMAVVILCATAILVSFSQIAKHLYVLFGGFNANNAGYWHWLRFGVSKLLEGPVLDIAGGYKLQLSEIVPTDIWSQTLVLIFRTSLQILVLATLFREFRRWRHYRAFNSSPTSPRAGYFRFILPSIGTIIIMAVWAVPTAIGIGALARDGLDAQATWLAFRFGVPVFLSVWLTWTSVQALFSLGGLRNKFFSVAGIGVGLWLLSTYQPALWQFIYG